MDTVFFRRKSLGGKRIAGIVVAVLAVILFLGAYFLFRFVRPYRGRQEQQRADNEFWHCRGKPEDLEHVPAACWIRYMR